MGKINNIKNKQITNKMKNKKRVKVQTTPSGTYRVQKMVSGFRFSRTFAKKKEAVAFSKSFA